ncbi:MAG: LysR family transcriptional regulator [Gammaproteobacteria bacterium]|nr:LysR family transcriptional regulator [Gammaproteobacteria bacterium]MBU1603374.1 LysR family transcriptional regulator [Gammaproteobacteria bacterium]MBU2432894.1 LysR family transcriptional regulator [Gammaproteobacteria bacterium]MBU2450137.1 LysR family transcriptional regulator [Gammaproteobacteria bacterium]
MELRQLRYLVRTIELGSISQAALDLGIAQSAVSLQIQRLEGELSTRLLQRTTSGVVPTDAGIAFLSHAQLALRHADQAMLAAQQSRLSGVVGLGLAPTTAGVLGLPLLQAMQVQYPDIRIHLVEGMSGHLGQMLNAREIDLAVLFGADQARRWTVQHLLDERLFLVCSAQSGPAELPITLSAISELPLVLPTHHHGLRRVIDTLFSGLVRPPNIVAEVDSLSVLMDMVAAGMASTLQPWSALARQPEFGSRLRWVELADAEIARRNLLCSLSDDELSPAALATRGALRQVVRQLVNDGQWKGVTEAYLESR